jgi:hypothetical protein
MCLPFLPSDLLNNDCPYQVTGDRMKIRTDFVTNSSSYCSAYIVIDNPTLLEILQKYKDLGVFANAETIFEIGSYKNLAKKSDSVYGHYSLTDYEVAVRSYGEKTTKTPAFFCFESDNPPYDVGSPDSLVDVLAHLIEVIGWEDNHVFDYDQDLYEQMKKELHQREAEIKAGYKAVNWSYSRQSDYLETGDETESEFSYDPDNGEKYHVEYYEGEDK